MGVCEVNFFDMTNGLGAIRFLVLAAKPLVLSKNFVSQTPLKMNFRSRLQNFGSKIAKMTNRGQILGVKIHSKPTMRENRFIVLV